MRIYKIFIVVLLFSFSLTINLKADSEKMALGLEVYNNKAMCGTCHTLKAAASEGDIGPNLDSLKPSEEQVKGVVTEGLGVMPAFGEEGLLTSEEIDAVSYYVVNSAGK
jgi:cytochrome c6